MIVPYKKKLTMKEGEDLGWKSNSIGNFRRNDIAKINHNFMIDQLKNYDLYKNAIKKLGRPNVLMKDYESSPGLWVFDDTDSNIRFLVWSDAHRKNAFKGTSYEVIAEKKQEKDLAAAFTRLLDYLRNL